MFCKHLRSSYRCLNTLSKVNKLNNCRFFSSKFDISQGLSEEQIQFQDMALDFAENEMLPYAEEWDQKKIFPEDVFKKAAELGFGGLFVSEDVGGINIKRSDGAVIFEALSTGCVSYSIFNNT